MATATAVKSDRLVTIIQQVDPKNAMFISAIGDKLMMGENPFKPEVVIDLSN